MSGEQSDDGRQGHPYAGAYGNPYGEPVGTRPRNSLGVAALVLGIAGLLLCWAVVGLVPALVGLVMGIVALRRVRRGLATNRGVALTAVVISAVATVACVVLLAVYVWLFTTAWQNGGQEYADCVAASGGSQAAVDRCAQQYGQDFLDRVERR